MCHYCVNNHVFFVENILPNVHSVCTKNSSFRLLLLCMCGLFNILDDIQFLSVGSILTGVSS